LIPDKKAPDDDIINIDHNPLSNRTFLSEISGIFRNFRTIPEKTETFNSKAQSHFYLHFTLFAQPSDISIFFLEQKKSLKYYMVVYFLLMIFTTELYPGTFPFHLAI